MFDGLGRLYATSNPYRPCAGETAKYTTTLFDALDRPTSVTTPDGSAIHTSYTGSQVTVTDPASVQRMVVTDALGPTTEVVEGRSLIISYAYDPLNDLTLVCQGAALQSGACPASGTQARECGHLHYGPRRGECGATGLVASPDGDLEPEGL